MKYEQLNWDLIIVSIITVILMVLLFVISDVRLQGY